MQLLPQILSKTPVRLMLYALTICTLTSCASIVSTNQYPVLLSSSPNGANVVIKNLQGEVLHEGQTPMTCTLKSGAGYFKQAYYTATFSLPDYESRTVPVRFEFDQMYWGNAIGGGLIGMLIVDPLSGAMYQLKDEYVHVVLRRPALHAHRWVIPKIGKY